MTHTTESMVTQADRDLVISLGRYGALQAAAIRRGDWDDDHSVQLAARHRTAAQPEREAVWLNDIAVMMSEFVDNWPKPKRISTALALIAKTIRAALDPPKHKFWGAGEPDCPREIKAGNGELHTLRCKVCGEENPRDDRCLAALTTPAPAVSTDEAVAVLKPFAHEYRTAGADHLPDEMRWVDASGDVPSDPVICCALTVGDLRRAAAILARLGEGE